MTRALKYDIPGIDWRVSTEDVRAKGVAAIFADDPRGPSGLDASAQLVVEIGFGRGEFVTALARESPGIAHLAIELAFKRVLKFTRRLARTELRNVRLLQERGERAVHELLAPDSVSTFWVNFPDPWPKPRHARRRLLQPEFVHLLATRLRPGGLLQIGTDDLPYALEIAAALEGEALLENPLAPEAWVAEMPGRSPTAYELEWRAEGRPLHFFTRRRSPGSRTA
jgi:tRNA (guanine-N7-)-methyltransferase